MLLRNNREAEKQSAKDTKKGDEVGMRVDVSRLHSDDAAVTIDPRGTASFLDGAEPGDPKAADDGGPRENLDALGRLFHGTWTDALHRVRRMLACAVAALLVLSAVLALHIGPMVEPELLLPLSHPLIQAGDTLNKHLGGGKSNDLFEVRVL